jgi:hypothetical protein
MPLQAKAKREVSSRSVTALGAGLLTTAFNICGKAADRKISRLFQMLPREEAG